MVRREEKKASGAEIGAGAAGGGGGGGAGSGGESTLRCEISVAISGVSIAACAFVLTEGTRGEKLAKRVEENETDETKPCERWVPFYFFLAAASPLSTAPLLIP